MGRHYYSKIRQSIYLLIASQPIHGLLVNVCLVTVLKHVWSLFLLNIECCQGSWIITQCPCIPPGEVTYIVQVLLTFLSLKA